MSIHLNAFTQCSICPQSKGQWKHPLDRSSHGYRDLAYWAEIARTLERGRFDALFFADVHGTYDVYQGSRDAAVRHAVQIPSHDPTVLIPALAMVTSHLGFAATYSTSYHAPYHTAKLFSTLDHLTGGRVAWNVVTSYLRDSQEQGMGPTLPHDERYDRAEEYMEVVYKLWEQSWEEDAIVRDHANDVHTDPAKVHEINHQGRYYQVRGPHLCEPSPQRTPVLYQAGSSPRGLQFGARHGEALFVVFPNTAVCRMFTTQIRELARQNGRDPAHVKILTAVTPIVGVTQEDAQRKYELARSQSSIEGALALFGGWTGIDLSTYDPDERLAEIESDGMQFLARFFSSVDTTREWRIRDIWDWLAIGSIGPVVVGDARHVADELQRWVEEGGVDGFNIGAVYAPGAFVDFVDLVCPELQRRGLLRTEYEGTTLRERYFGPGQRRLSDDHVGARYARHRTPR